MRRRRRPSSSSLAPAARQALRAGRPADAGGCAAALALWGEPLPEDTYADWARPPRERLRRARIDVLRDRAPVPRSRWGTRAPRPATPPTRSPTTPCASRPCSCWPRRWRRRATGPGRWPRWTVCAPGSPTSSASTRRRRSSGCSWRCCAARSGARTPGGPVRRPHAAPARPFGELAFVGRDRRAGPAARGAVRRARARRCSAASPGRASRGCVAEADRGTSPLPVLAARAFLPERAEAWGLARSVLREALALDAAVADALRRARPRRAGRAPARARRRSDVRWTARAAARSCSRAACGCSRPRSARRRLLVADDLQWADPAASPCSRPRWPGCRRLAAVLAFRPEELASTPQRAATGLRGTRARPSEIRARRPLPDAAVAALVGDPGWRARCARPPTARRSRSPRCCASWRPAARSSRGRTGGGTARDAVGRRARGGGSAGRGSAARRGGARRGRPACAREVLALLALLAREAPAQTVAAAAGVEPRAVLDALSGLTAAGLVRLGEQGWATAHDLVAETVTAGLGAGERGRLHGLLARALEAEDADPSEIGAPPPGRGRRHRRGARVPAGRRTGAGRARHAERRPLADDGLALEPGRLRADLLDARAEARAAHGDRRRGRGPAGRARRDRPRAAALAAARPARDADLRRAGRVRAAGAGRARARRGGRRRRGPRRRAGDRRDPRHEHRPDRSAAEERAEPRSRSTAASATPRASRGSSTAGRWPPSSTGASPRPSRLFGRVARLFADSGELLRAVTPRSTRGHGLVFAGEPAAGLAETVGGAAPRPRAGAPRRARRTRCGTGRRRCPRWGGRRGRGRRPRGAASPAVGHRGLDGHRAPRARHRAGRAGRAGRGRGGVRGVGGGGGGDAHAVRLVGRGAAGPGGARRGRYGGRWPPGGARAGGRSAAGTLRGAAGRRWSWPPPRGADGCACSPPRPGTGPGRVATSPRCRASRSWRAGRDRAAALGICTDPRRRGQPRAGADQRLPGQAPINHGFRSPERPSRLRRVSGVFDDQPLWTCTGCGRTFANRNQTHTCAPLGSSTRTSPAAHRRSGRPSTPSSPPSGRRTGGRPAGAHPHRPARPDELRRVHASAPLARRPPRARAPDRQPPLPAGRGLLPAQRPARIPPSPGRARWTPSSRRISPRPTGSARRSACAAGRRSR